MLQHVAIEGIERGIVDVGRDHAFAEVIEHHDASHAAQPAKRFLVQLSPDARAGAEHQQPDGFSAVAQRHHEQPRAPVLAASADRAPWGQSRNRLALLRRAR